MKRFLALLASLACALGLASCGNTSWVAKYNDQVISDQLYIGYLVLAYQQAAYQLQSTGAMTTGTDLLSQKIDGKEAPSWIKDTALDLVFNHLASQELAQELGFEWQKDQLDQTVAEAQQLYLSSDYGAFSTNGVSQEAFLDLYKNVKLQDYLFQAIYGEGGTKAVPEEEIKTYFNDNFLSVKVIEIQTVDASGQLMGDEELASIKSKLEGYLARYQQGTPMDTLTLEYNKEQENLSEGQESTAQAAESFLLTRDTSQYSQYPQLPKLIDAVAGMEVNTAQVVDATYSCFLVERLPLDARESDYTDNKSSFLTMMKGEEFSADMEARAQKIEQNSDLNKSALKRYAPDKLVMS